MSFSFFDVIFFQNQNQLQILPNSRGCLLNSSFDKGQHKVIQSSSKASNRVKGKNKQVKFQAHPKIATVKI